MNVGLPQDRVIGSKVVLAPMRAGRGARSRSSVLLNASAAIRRMASAGHFLPRVKPAEALVEARDLAAFLDLPSAAGPCRMNLRIDVEVERVAFLAPGRAGLELGAVGHFDVDHVIIGVNAGLHVDFPWVSRWFPTSGSKFERRLYRESRKVATKRRIRRSAAPCPREAAAARCSASAKPPNSSAA